MTKEYLLHYFAFLSADWTILLKLTLILLLAILIAVALYDRYIQRHNQLLINYPLIGRLRYFFYLLRNPMRQYFGDETFFDSFEKLNWVTKVSAGKNPYLSFSPTKPYGNQMQLFRHANFVKEVDEVNRDFAVSFGEGRPHPFVARSIVGRSAMSNGAISPEGTRAFARGAFYGAFPINTGEGGLTSNFLSTLYCSDCHGSYLEQRVGTWFARGVYALMRRITNPEIAQRVFRRMVVRQADRGTFIFDAERRSFF